MPDGTWHRACSAKGYPPVTHPILGPASDSGKESVAYDSDKAFLSEGAQWNQNQFSEVLKGGQ